MTAPPTRLPALTGLRFFLALWVVLFHARDWVQQEYLFRWIDKGYLGVDFFFVLSGFILAYVYHPSFVEKAFTGREYLRFIQKRFAKIYPVHLVTFLAVLFLFVMGTSAETRGKICNVWENLLMVHAWGTYCEGCPAWNHPSWSISAEWFAYLFCFPLGAWLLRKTSHWLLLAVTLVAWAGLIAYTMWGVPLEGSISVSGTGFPIVRIIPEFLSGMWMYCIFHYRKDLIRRITVPATLVMSLLFLVALFLGFRYLDYFLLPLFSGVIASVGVARGIVNRFLSHRFMVYLGNISYSLYMVQFPVILLLGKIFPVLAVKLGIPAGAGVSTTSAVLYIALLILLNLVTASLCYHVVEEPLRKMISRLGTRKAPALTP